MNNFSTIVEIIKQNDKFVLSGHINPDGDCIGATISLALALKKMGKEATIYLESFLPLFHYLEGKELICTEAKPLVKDQVAIMLDSSDEGRLGDAVKFLQSDNITINIDHHASNNNYCDYNYVESDASSTCEIVYNLINELGIEIDINIANAIYTGLVYDTGVFRHPNTKSSTHNVASHLLEIGVDASEIINRIFFTKSLIQAKLLGLALSKIELFYDNRIAISSITRDELKEYGGQVSDVDGIVQYISQVDTVEGAIFLYEKEENIFKVSLRSKKTLDVAKLANIFGGGGHVKAAGCTIEATLDDAKKSLIKVLSDFRSEF